MQMRLSEVAAQIKAEHIGNDVAFSTVSTDTRSIGEGDLFVALQGDNFDGHDYLSLAQENGAVAAMVSKQLEMVLPMLKVDDTRTGLGQLSSMWRSSFGIPVVAVTGSNGKTTVKEMIAEIMAQQGDVLSTIGNLNNDIGVPLTLLRIQDHHRSAVIEMGANHHGEISYLTGLTRPDVAVITNAGAAHLEGFGDIAGVAKAKGEIFDGLNMNGTAIINADDDFASYWIDRVGARNIISFGLEQQADVTASWSGSDAIKLHMQTPLGECDISLPLQGRHNVMNVLAATAAAIAMGAELEMIKAGLEGIEAVPGRLQLQQGPAGMKILNDTYNANPDSFTAAVDVLVGMPGQKWLVLGDMGELGSEDESIHAECGRVASDKGVDRLFAVGELSRHAVDAFNGQSDWFETTQQLVDQLSREWTGEGAVLVKGSRRMHMEDVVTALQTEEAGE